MDSRPPLPPRILDEVEKLADILFLIPLGVIAVVPSEG
jgi:hypothetical protein